MKLEEIEVKLKERFQRPLLAAHILLDKFRLIDESSRKSSAYTDPMYIPFYYYLGTLVQPCSMVEIGFRLGLFSACFLRGCTTVQNFLGFQEKTDTYYSPKLGKANVKDHYKKAIQVYVGQTTDEALGDLLGAREWDLALINEEVSYDKHMAYLDTIWPVMSENGLVVMDYIQRHDPARQAFDDFCKVRNRRPVKFDTRYGVGIVQK